MTVHLWPSAPNPDSWTSDVPNEGLRIGYNCGEDVDEEGIADFSIDYQGLYIVDPEATDNTLFLRPCFGGTRNPQYLDAYRVIIEECADCWHNPVPPEGQWPAVAQRIITRLYTMGWQDVEPHEYDDEDGNHCYWREVRT